MREVCLLYIYLKNNNKMKNLYIAIASFVSIISFAQVGIGIEKPLKDLHVNGGVQMTKDFNVGGTENTKGDPGKKGQVLMSQGLEKPPKWGEIKQIKSLPYIAAIAKHKATRNEAPNIASGVTTTIQYPNPTYMDSEYVSFLPSMREFEIKTSGFYRVYVTLTYDTEDNADGATAGEARTFVIKNNSIAFAKSSYHGERTTQIFHSLSGLEHFNVGDKISVQAFRHQNHKIVESDISIVFSGDIQSE